MDNMPGMENMPGMAPPTNATSHDQMIMIMSHMTFYWGKNSEILFSDWPGSRTGMYVLALVFVFALSLLVEWLSHCRWNRSNSEKWDNKSVSDGLIQTVVYGTRITLAYLVMLAVMSFNVGVLIVAVAGHVFGFLLFGSGLFFKKSAASSDV